jgi:tetratricopeptide (TPR) repeat protein
MAAAHARFAEALALYRQAVDPWGIARGLCNLANSTLRLNRPEAARGMIEEAVPILEALGERFILHTALYRLQVIDLEMGSFVTARALFQRSLALAQEIRDQEGVQVAFITYSRVLSIQGDYETARSQLEAALAVWRECGGGVPLGVISAALLENDLATGDLSSARQRLAAGLSAGDTAMNRSIRAHALYCQGLLAYREGDLDGAAALLDGSTSVFREIQAEVGLGYALVALGRALRAQGRAGSAEALVREGLSLLQQRQHKLGVATALEALAGLVADAHGEQAAMLFGMADAIRQAIGAPLPPIDRAAYDRDVASVSAQLDEIAFAQAWAEGQASPFEAIANAVLHQDAA